MRLVLIAVVLLSAGCEQFTTRAAEPSKTLPGEVAFKLARPGASAILVPVRINGQGPYDFILDTGATLTCVDAALARDLSLPEKRGIRGVAASVDAASPMELVELETLHVGSAVGEDILACTVDLSNLEKVGLSGRGLLGLNFLKHYRVTIDFDRGSLQLAEPGTCPRPRRRFAKRIGGRCPMNWQFPSFRRPRAWRADCSLCGMYEDGWNTFLGRTGRSASAASTEYPPEYHVVGGRRFLQEMYLPNHAAEIAAEELALLHAIRAADADRAMAVAYAQRFVVLRESRRCEMPDWLIAEEDLWERLDGIPAYVERCEVIRWGGDITAGAVAKSTARARDDGSYARTLGRLQAELLDSLQTDEERGSPAVWVPLLFAGTRHRIMSLFDAVKEAVRPAGATAPSHAPR